MLIIAVVAAAIYGVFDLYKHREFHQLDGILAPKEPLQVDLRMPPFKHKGQIIEPLASFEIQARILSTENYYLDPGAKLSPIDLAMGWGPMSDSRVLRELDISQNGRFYYYSWKVAPPLPEETMRTHSSNIHIVPQDDLIESEVKALRKGQVVKLKGYLIEVSAFDGGGWKSSLTRGDTGKGACELFFVTSVVSDVTQMN